MSRRTQIAFLERLHKELSKSSDIYRDELNQRVQVLQIKKSTIFKAVYERLDTDVLQDPEISEEIKDKYRNEVKRKISRHVGKAINVLRKEVLQEIAKDNGLELISLSSNEILVRVVAGKRGGVSRFDRAIGLYTSSSKNRPLDIAAKQISNELLKIGIDKSFSAGSIWHLEHDNRNASVVERMVSESLKRSVANQRTQTSASVRKYLKSLEVDLSITQSPAVGRSDVFVFIGSGARNLKEGGQLGAKKRALAAAVGKSLATLRATKNGRLETLKGSDSISDTKKKQTIKAVTSPLSRSKNLKVKVKKADKNIEKKVKKATIKKKGKGRTAGSTRKPRKTKTKINSPGSIPLLGVLNDRIREVVAQNMGSPRLNYRTGRFAGSVQIIDEVTTPGGFLSIGYTYQKYPYQTFEPGYAQGSPDRDPRKLIDFSIREIAIAFAQTRLYTRRL